MKIIFTLLIVALFFTLWTAICNYKTLNQRMDIIEIIYQDDNYNRETVSDYRSVTYNTHMWSLVFFQDPIKSYPESVQVIVRKSKAP